MGAAISPVLQEFAGFVFLGGGMFGAVFLIVRHSGRVQRALRAAAMQAFEEIADPSMRKIVRSELTATNGGSSHGDRIGKLEAVTSSTARAVEDIPTQFDRLRADLAVIAESGRERAATAEHRAERIEAQIERLDGRIDAVFQHPPHP